MSESGVVGLPGAFKAGLLNLRQQAEGGLLPLDGSQVGLPWQKPGRLQGYKGTPLDFEQTLREAMEPVDSMAIDVNKSSSSVIDSSVREVAALQGVEAVMAQCNVSSNPFFFNYLTQPMQGYHRTELARNAYSAMGRAG